MDAGAWCVCGAALTEDEGWEEGNANALQSARGRVGPGAVPHLWHDLSPVLGGSPMSKWIGWHNARTLKWIRIGKLLITLTHDTRLPFFPEHEGRQWSLPLTRHWRLRIGW
jgi:hypothetical protein